LAHSMASSSDLAWMIQYPATSSFDSVKGPSMTVRFPPANLTRAPSALGWRPERSSRTPAFASSSLYLPIAASSSSLGSWPGFGSPLIIMRNRMAPLLPVRAGPRSVLDRVRTLPLPARRSRPGEIDIPRDSSGEPRRERPDAGPAGSGGRTFLPQRHQLEVVPVGVGERRDPHPLEFVRFLDHLRTGRLDPLELLLHLRGFEVQDHPLGLFGPILHLGVLADGK